jgi:hypothetical protein
MHYYQHLYTITLEPISPLTSYKDMGRKHPLHVPFIYVASMGVHGRRQPAATLPPLSPPLRHHLFKEDTGNDVTNGP